MGGRQETARAAMLLVTSDEQIHDEVSRVAASVSVPIEIAPGPGEAMTAWRRASMVLVGGDCAGPMARMCPERRRSVAVVRTNLADLAVYRHALDIGAVTVLELPQTQSWINDALAESQVEDEPRGVTLGVIGAAGGVGATVLAAAVALLGAARTSTVLVDLDPVGAGIEWVLGCDEVDPVTSWQTLGSGTLSPRGLRESVPVHRGVSLVGFGRGAPRAIDPDAARAVLVGCGQAFGLTVVDIPRSQSSAAEEAIVRCDLIVVLCPESIAAVMAGRRLVASLLGVSDIALVTRAGPRQVDSVDIAEALGIPLLISAGDQRGLEEALAAGRGPLHSRGSGLRRLAQAILDHALVGP